MTPSRFALVVGVSCLMMATVAWGTDQAAAAAQQKKETEKPRPKDPQKRPQQKDPRDKQTTTGARTQQEAYINHEQDHSRPTKRSTRRTVERPTRVPGQNNTKTESQRYKRGEEEKDDSSANNLGEPETGPTPVRDTRRPETQQNTEAEPELRHHQIDQ
ncbi:uncharacterized protein LOC120429780 [Culex pipiens pallens]|uniref:uncharacterized protein LOC120429780 n=1 Tax=Culex pipiens pallens TaxID=42434 RepID=UPI001953E798|nr:uncharacterized protein LOC120429780 [Culex pipiens pallens]